MPLRVAIFDDVLAARREVFHIPGLEVGVYGDADDVCLICSGERPPDVVCMDYAMGPQHANGADAIRAVRTIGFSGKIVAMSSDPAANAAMIAAGANESLLQKSMLRSYLVALGAGRLKEKEKQNQTGFVALPLVLMLGAIASLGGGIVMIGPLGHEPRYQGDFVRVAVRVLPQGSPRSEIDGVPVAAEALSVWGAKGKKAFDALAGGDQLRDASFRVAALGRAWTVETTAATRWRLNPGPSRRLRFPEDVSVGRGLPAFLDTRYVARTQRVVEGQNLWIVGFQREDRLLASEITDEDHVGALGPLERGRLPVQLGGLALLGLGALLLGAASRS
jgi:CheY-like chemotaxis protein